jgi:hypothetical protein
VGRSRREVVSSAMLRRLLLRVASGLHRFLSRELRAQQGLVLQQHWPRCTTNLTARRYEQYGVGSEVPTICPRHWYGNVNQCAPPSAPRARMARQWPNQGSPNYSFAFAARPGPSQPSHCRLRALYPSHISISTISAAALYRPSVICLPFPLSLTLLETPPTRPTLSDPTVSDLATHHGGTPPSIQGHVSVPEQDLACDSQVHVHQHQCPAHCAWWRCHEQPPDHCPPLPGHGQGSDCPVFSSGQQCSCWCFRWIQGLLFSCPEGQPPHWTCRQGSGC